VRDLIAVSTEILRRLPVAGNAERPTEAAILAGEPLVQKKQALQKRLSACGIRGVAPAGGESQLESPTRQIQEGQIALGQLSAELAIAEAEIHRRSPVALKGANLECKSHVAQIRAE
jgi:hypothetical protein